MTISKIYIGSDHGGLILKQKIKDYLAESFGSLEVEDLGPFNDESVDYPEYGAKVAQATVSDSNSLGIVICGSGIGISIAANKVPGARCALCVSTELASLARQHNGAQILALGERTKSLDDPLDIIQTFLTTEVDPSERHERRRTQLGQIQTAK